MLKSPFNSSLDADIFKNLNLSDHTLWLVSRYFEEGCERVFVPGIRLENYVPQAAVIDNGQIDDGTGKHVRPTGIASHSFKAALSTHIFSFIIYLV